MLNLLLTTGQMTTIFIFCGLCAFAIAVYFLASRKSSRSKPENGSGVYVVENTVDKNQERLLKAAEAGDAEAQVELAGTYEFKESGKYIYWLEKAAEQDYEEAIRTLADEYNYGNEAAEPKIEKDRTKAAEYLARLADKGDVKAMKDLSLLYAVEFNDDEKSREWTEKAAEAGDLESIEDIGFEYRANPEIKNFEKSEYWFKKAIDAGSVKAIRYLGDLYCYFEGREDYFKAESLYRKALAAGDNFSYIRLGDMHKEGNGFAKDEAAAFECYKKAADKGETLGKVKLSECYKSGSGVERSESKAFEILNAIKEESIFVYYPLGMCYFEGTGTKQDYDKAFGLFKKGSKYDKDSQNKLGECYCFGYGVEADKKEAHKLWLEAAERGSKQAAENLKAHFNETVELPDE